MLSSFLISFDQPAASNSFSLMMHQQAPKYIRGGVSKLRPADQLWTHHLYLHDPHAENGFYIFLMIEKNQNNNSGHVKMKFECECQISVSVNEVLLMPNHAHPVPSILCIIAFVL